MDVKLNQKDKLQKHKYGKADKTTIKSEMQVELNYTDIMAIITMIITMIMIIMMMTITVICKLQKNVKQKFVRS